MTLFTAEDVLQDLEAVVREFGENYVYPDDLRQDGRSCVYATEDETPRCIVGQVFARHGLLGKLKLSEAGATNCYSNGSVEYIVGSFLPGVFTERAVRVLTAAQRAQDNNKTWGSALQRARAEARQ